MLAPAAVLLPRPVRAAVVFGFLLLVPGAAVVVLLDVRDLLSKALLVLTVSLALLVAAGQTMVSLGVWSPYGLVAVLAPAAAVVLGWQAVAGRPGAVVRRRPWSRRRGPDETPAADTR